MTEIFENVNQRFCTMQEADRAMTIPHLFLRKQTSKQEQLEQTICLETAYQTEMKQA